MHIDKNSRTWEAVKDYVKRKQDELAEKILSVNGADREKDEERRQVRAALQTLIEDLEKQQ